MRSTVHDRSALIFLLSLDVAKTFDVRRWRGGGGGVEADDESPLIIECLNVGRYDDV